MYAESFGKSDDQQPFRTLLIDFFFRTLFNLHEHHRVIFFLNNNRTIKNDARLGIGSNLHITMEIQKRKTQNSPFL